jgi:hypothetical protein
MEMTRKGMRRADERPILVCRETSGLSSLVSSFSSAGLACVQRPNDQDGEAHTSMATTRWKSSDLALSNGLLARICMRMVQSVGWPCKQARTRISASQLTECSVPLDYQNSSAGIASIALSRFKATSFPRKGIIMVNPGVCSLWLPYPSLESSLRWTWDVGHQGALSLRVFMTDANRLSLSWPLSWDLIYKP